MGTHTDQFIQNIKNILADKVMSAREIYSALLNEVLPSGLKRRLVPSHQQIVGLLRNPKNFTLVEAIPVARSRKILKYSNVLQEEE